MRAIYFLITFFFLSTSWSHSYHHDKHENQFRDAPTARVYSNTQPNSQFRNSPRVIIQTNNHHHNAPIAIVRPNIRVPQQCIRGPFGNEVCGYNCIRSIHNAVCANTPDQHCVADNFGHIACGYGCVESPFKVACAPRPWQSCVMNQFNEIRCGRNCRTDAFGHLYCD